MPVRFAILGPDPTDEDVDDFLGALGVTKKLEEKVEERYSPDQPRVPAGVSDQGGEWTAAAGFGGKTAPGPDIEAYNSGKVDIEPSASLWKDAGADYGGANSGPSIDAKIAAAKAVSARVGETLTEGEVTLTPFGREWMAAYGELTPMENVIAALHDQWADTSGDSNVTALALQKVAREEFGLKGVDDPLESYGHENDIDMFGDVNESIRVNGALFRAYVHAEYDNTQEFLARNKITELVLYRGVALQNNEGSDRNDPLAVEIGDNFTTSVTAHVTTNPLSSFSARTSVAADFARGQADEAAINAYILSERIPASRIFSTPMTGAGCLNEFEAIVLGSSGDTAAAWQL